MDCSLCISISTFVSSSPPVRTLYNTSIRSLSSVIVTGYLFVPLFLPAGSLPISSPVPGTNLTTFLAGILMLPPVCGLWPLRAGRSLTANEPNPGIRIFSSLCIASVMAFSTAFTAVSDSFTLMPPAAATLLTNSFLFIGFVFT